MCVAPMSWMHLLNNRMGKKSKKSKKSKKLFYLVTQFRTSCHDNLFYFFYFFYFLGVYGVFLPKMPIKP